MYTYMICDFKIPFPNKYFQAFRKKFIAYSMEKGLIIAMQVLQPGLKYCCFFFYFEPGLKYKEQNR